MDLFLFRRRHSTSVLLLVSALLIGVIVEKHVIEGYMLGNDPTRRGEYLDPDGKFLLEWETLWPSKRIVFNVTVQTRGYVALGFSAGGGAGTSGEGGEDDLVIAGVLRNGKTYFSDYHTFRHGEGPRVDSSQDYTLHTAWESRTHTFVSFSRPLDSCDSHDYPITDNRASVVWGYGQQDNHGFSWENDKRGTYDLYLLDPDHSPRIVRDPSGAPVVESEERLRTWTISRKATIPSNDTAYLCSIHKTPRLRTKHHAIGFDVYFADTESRDRVHHLIIYKCQVSQGFNPRMFEPFVDGPSQNCYLPSKLGNGPIPTYFCDEYYYSWAVGGRATFTPSHVGFPFASTPNEYYMLQTHYDNPQQRAGIVVQFRLDIFYTGQLRPHDGAMMAIGHDVPGLAPSLLIPPASSNHRIYGHCSPQCTSRMLPNDGIKVVATFLHSHSAGRRLRLHHFSSRNRRQEQPWIMLDDNYSNVFQPFRHMRDERKIYPGDHIIVNCSYDTAMNNGSTVVGGFPTSQEMCVAFLFYYNKIPDYSLCRSDVNSVDYRQRLLGITNITWVEDRLEWVATDSNSSLRGLTVKEISDGYVNWDDNKRRELQRFHESHNHVARCSRRQFGRSPEVVARFLANAAEPLTQEVPINLDTPDDFSGPVGYPFGAKAYVPQKACSFGGWSS